MVGAVGVTAGALVGAVVGVTAGTLVGAEVAVAGAVAVAVAVGVGLGVAVAGVVVSNASSILVFGSTLFPSTVTFVASDVSVSCTLPLV